MNDIIASASIYAALMSIYYTLLPSGAATPTTHFGGERNAPLTILFYGEVNNTYPQTFGSWAFPPVSSVISSEDPPPPGHQKDFLIFPLQIKKTPLYLQCNSKGKGVKLNPDSTSSTPYINTQRIG